MGLFCVCVSERETVQRTLILWPSSLPVAAILGFLDPVLFSSKGAAELEECTVWLPVGAAGKNLALKNFLCIPTSTQECGNLLALLVIILTSLPPSLLFFQFDKAAVFWDWYFSLFDTCLNKHCM